MKVLVVGGGGREHALAWKLAQSPRVDEVQVAPGNAGTASEPRLRNVPIAAEAIDELLAHARAEGIDLTVVGPEAPLVAGIVDRFEQAGLRCFGPRAAAAELEGSKAYSKEFMARHGIPTAAYATFTDAAEARDYIRAQGAPIVVKASGLAAGKGVVVAQTVDEALRAVDDMLSGGAYGDAGRRVVIEEYLEGEEASYMVVAAGRDWIPFASSQDHKARDAGDRGPNTGGMGAYTPAPVVTPEIEARIAREVIEPTLAGLEAEGRRYQGFLYAGLMILPDGSVRVLEYNCRLGDPETQPLMLRLESDLAALCLAALDGGLAGQQARWDTRAALGVVLAAEGYPGSYRKGDAITGLDAEEPGADTKVFHAGTAIRDGRIVTSGGRVLCVCALGETIGEAQSRAYARVRGLHWEGMFYRPDIGHRALARDGNPPRHR